MSLPDPRKYRDLIEDPNLTDEQKDELVLAVWGLMSQVVDLAYGRHPSQLAQKSANSNAADLQTVH